MRALWALYHSVQHSSPDFNLSTAFRVWFVDRFFSPLLYLPLVAVGFHPTLILFKHPGWTPQVVENGEQAGAVHE